MEKANMAAVPSTASKLIVEKLDHIQARANALRATLANLSEFLIGPRPKAEPEKADKSKPCSFVGLVTERLNDIYDLVSEAHGEVEDLRSRL